MNKASRYRMHSYEHGSGGERMMRAAPWWPMVKPPLPARGDFLRNLCEHAFTAEYCPTHGEVSEEDMADFYAQGEVG